MFGNTNESVIEQSAEGYLKKYRPQVEAFESYSLLAKTGASVTASDIYALGKQLDQYESYANFCESNGTLAELGAIPSIALDVVSGSYGASILPLVASTQPIDEEQGIIYFKQIRATKSQQGRTAGQIITDARGGENHSDTYGAYETKLNTPILTTAAGTTSYTVNLADFPVRPYTVNIETTIAGVRAIDDGKGNIMGKGLHGTINYDTGVMALEFFADPGVAGVTGKYAINAEAADDIVGISGSLVSEPIRAEVFALKSEAGLLQEYAFAKRFGRQASEEVAQDLSGELGRVLNARAIKAMADAVPAGAEVTWSKTPPAGVSYAEHKLTFVDAFSQAEAKLNFNANRGNITRLICGTNAAATLRGLPGFTPSDSGLAFSVGLYGYWNSVPVIRAANLIDADTIIASYKGASYFESPLVHAPYMPLFVSSTMGTGANPLRNQRVAAIWAGMKVVIPNFLVKIKIVA